MYHRIVAYRIRRTFDRLNHGDRGAVIDQLATAFTYHFAGEHALSGTRTQTDSLRRWFDRLFTVFPDPHFTLREVLIRGWPWRTSAAVFATFGSTIAGIPYDNDFSQRISLRWGRITSIELLEDTQRCAAALAVQAKNGIADAAASPIDDNLVTRGARLITTGRDSV